MSDKELQLIAIERERRRRASGVATPKEGIIKKTADKALGAAGSLSQGYTFGVGDDISAAMAAPIIAAGRKIQGAESFNLPQAYADAKKETARQRGSNPLAVQRGLETVGVSMNPLVKGAGKVVANVGSKVPVAGKLISAVGSSVANPTKSDLVTAMASGMGSGAVEEAGGGKLAQAAGGIIAGGSTGIALGAGKAGLRALGKGATSPAPAPAGTELIGNALNVAPAPEFKKVRQLVRANYRGAKKIEKAAWDAFGNTGRKAVFQPEDIGQLAAKLNDRATVLSIDGANEIARMNGIMEKTIANTGAADIMDIRNIRKLATNLAASSNSEKRAAGKAALQEIDGFFDEAIKSGKLNAMGKKSVKQLQEALAVSRQNAKTFVDPTDVAKIITKDAGNQRYITPESVGALIIGKAGTPAEAANTIDAVLKSVAPQNREQALNAIRRGTMHNMLAQSVKSSKNGDVVDAYKFAQNLAGLKRNNPSVWSKFTPGQRAQIERYIASNSSKSPLSNASRYANLMLLGLTGRQLGTATSSAGNIAGDIFSSPQNLQAIIKQLNSPIPVGKSFTMGSTGIPALSNATINNTINQREERP